MFCTSCGNKINEGQKFCVKCGAKVISYESDNKPESRVERKPEKKVERKPEKKPDNTPGNNAEVMPDMMFDDEPYVSPGLNSGRSTSVNTQGNVPGNTPGAFSGNSPVSNNSFGNGIGIDKKMIAGAAALVTVIIVMLLFIAFHKPSINVEDYVTVDYSGSNHYATAEVELDREGLVNDAINNGLIKADEYHRLLDLTKYISMTVTNTEGLSNGDEVDVEIQYDKKQFKNFGIRLKGKNKKVKIENLSDVIEIDAFDKIEVTFEGTSPHVSANVELKDDELKYYVSPEIEGDSYEIKLGDKIKVVLNVDENELLEEKGMHVTALSKEYVCENVDAYVDSASQIPENIMESMRSNADDYFRSNAASNWDPSVSIKSYEPVGNYFLKRKDGDDWSYQQNQIYLIFKATVKKEGEKKFSYYHYVKYTDIIMLKDGTCSVDISSFDAPSGSWFSDEGFEKYDLYFGGYKDMDSLFNHCVTSQIDEYEYEDNTGDGSAKTSGKDDGNDDGKDAEKNDGKSDAKKTDKSGEEDEPDMETSNGDYILPTSDSVKLTKSDIENLSLKELNYAKNEIYARHGRKFDSPELRAYFESKSWYNGTIDATDFSDNMLSDIEKANAALIKEMEYSIAPNGYQLDQ